MTLIEKDKTKSGYIGKCKGVFMCFTNECYSYWSAFKSKTTWSDIKKENPETFSLVLVWLQKYKLEKKSFEILIINKEIFSLKEVNRNQE